MNNEEKYRELRGAIIKAVPEIAKECVCCNGRGTEIFHGNRLDCARCYGSKVNVREIRLVFWA